MWELPTASWKLSVAAHLLGLGVMGFLLTGERGRGTEMLSEGRGTE